jgi:hypothetical protein
MVRCVYGIHTDLTGGVYSTVCPEMLARVLKNTTSERSGPHFGGGRSTLRVSVRIGFNAVVESDCICHVYSMLLISFLHP